VVVSVVSTVLLLFTSVFALRGIRIRNELERELAELRRRSRVEELTLLGNSEAFTEGLDLEVARGDRTGRAGSLLLVTLASECRTEETGPLARVVAEVIRSESRAIDAGYRIGINEFAIILPETRATGALVAAGRIDEKLRRFGAPAEAVTAGIAELGPGIDRHQLFRNAYSALLAAGHNGHPRLLVYSPELAFPPVDDLASFGAFEGPTG
jgi:GGDEF domain-containing protein